MRPGRPVRGVATGHEGGVAGGRCDTSPGGRGPACRETANRIGRIQHRDYDWSGGIARLRSRRPGGELGDFTARTRAMTRRVGVGRRQNARAATNTSSKTKTAAAPRTIHGTQAVSSDDTTAPSSCAECLSRGSSSALVIGHRGPCPWNPGAPLLLRRWQVMRRRARSRESSGAGATRERGDPLAGGLTVRSGYERGQQSCRLRQVQH